MEALRRRLRALAEALSVTNGFKGGFYARVFAWIVHRAQNFAATGLPA